MISIVSLFMYTKEKKIEVVCFLSIIIFSPGFSSFFIVSPAKNSVPKKYPGENGGEDNNDNRDGN